MSVPGPDAGARTAKGRHGNLMLRVASAAVLAPLALGTAYIGGWAFVLVWAAAAVAILWEWDSLSGVGRKVLAAGAAAIVVAAVAAGFREFPLAGGAVLAGAAASAVLAAADRRNWAAGGVVYAGAALIGPTMLRAGEPHGFLALVFLFGIVWGTDILAYFVGRALGGPKLAPTISPNKTWSGAIGGTLAAVAVGLAVAYHAGGRLLPIAAVAVLLSAVAQAGDLFESAVKRRFGAKDASQLIPGHGGVMDRLDGFLAAALFGAFVGALHRGLDAAGSGLVAW